jgi:hypothetical protein
MLITVQAVPLAEVVADWLVLGVWEQEAGDGAPADLDAKLDGLLTRLRTQGDLLGKLKELTPIYQTPGLAARRLLLVGFGPRQNADFTSLLSACAAAAKMLSGKPCARIALALPHNVPSLPADTVLSRQQHRRHSQVEHGTHAP